MYVYIYIYNRLKFHEPLKKYRSSSSGASASSTGWRRWRRADGWSCRWSSAESRLGKGGPKDRGSSKTYSLVKTMFGPGVTRRSYHEELINYDLILKDAGTPFLGTPFPELKQMLTAGASHRRPARPPAEGCRRVRTALERIRRRRSGRLPRSICRARHASLVERLKRRIAQSGNRLCAWSYLDQMLKQRRNNIAC